MIHPKKLSQIYASIFYVVSKFIDVNIRMNYESMKFRVGVSLLDGIESGMGLTEQREKGFRVPLPGILYLELLRDLNMRANAFM